MAYTPYDWTQNLQHRQDYIQDRLREGSPVVGLTYRGGIMLLTVRRAQEKIFEIYDRLMFSGVGHQADLEALRLAAIDFAHREGFSRSPEDVTAQRVVGVALSPLLKRSFGDFFSHPLVARCVFAELGSAAEEDAFYTLDFDGEFSLFRRIAGAAGSKKAEEDILECLEEGLAQGVPELPEAMKLALEAWARGRHRGLQPTLSDSSRAEPREAEDETSLPLLNPAELLRQELGNGAVEAALLEREAKRESKFRHLREEEISPALQEVLASGS